MGCEFNRKDAKLACISHGEESPGSMNIYTTSLSIFKSPRGGPLKVQFGGPPPPFLLFGGDVLVSCLAPHASLNTHPSTLPWRPEIVHNADHPPVAPFLLSSSFSLHPSNHSPNTRSPTLPIAHEPAIPFRALSL